MSSKKEKPIYQIIPKAISLLFVSSEISEGKHSKIKRHISKISEDQQAKITQYIKGRLSRIGTCVLWDRSSEFVNLLSKMGFSPDEILGKKEIIIGKNALRYSPNYKVGTPKGVDF